MKDFCIGLLSLVIFGGVIASCSDTEDAIDPSASVVHLEDSLTENGYFDGTLYYKKTSSSTFAVTKAHSSVVAVEIPQYVSLNGRNYTVTSVLDGTFYGCGELTSVKIPNTVSSIGYKCFSECKNLVEIVVEESNGVYDSRNHCNAIIETKSGNLIAGCNNSTIPSGVKSIDNYAFYSSNITQLDIPNSVSYIGKSAFEFCTELTSLHIQDGLTELEIDDDAFSDCLKLASLVIPGRVSRIGDYAFSGLRELVSIAIEDGVRIIGKNAFFSCSNLTDVSLSNNMTEISDGLFFECHKLESITIPQGVTSIGKVAFYRCDSLKSIELPYGVETIGNGAFYLCTSLATVTIPNSVTSIGASAFCGCDNITNIYCKAEQVPETGGDTFTEFNSVLHVPSSAVAAYKATEPWNKFREIIAIE